MASRVLTALSRHVASRATSSASSSSSRAMRRALQSSARQLDATLDAAPVAPLQRPLGAFRGGLLGFFLGTSAAAYGAYAFLLQDYRAANARLSEDLYDGWGFWGVHKLGQASS